MKTAEKLTAVEWLEKVYVYNECMITEIHLGQAKVMEEQQKVEFAFRAYSEMLSTGKSFVEIVNSMRTFKQQEQ
jgi:hypothetical protein